MVPGNRLRFEHDHHNPRLQCRHRLTVPLGNTLAVPEVNRQDGVEHAQDVSDGHTRVDEIFVMIASENGAPTAALVCKACSIPATEQARPS